MRNAMSFRNIIKNRAGHVGPARIRAIYQRLVAVLLKFVTEVFLPLR